MFPGGNRKVEYFIMIILMCHDKAEGWEGGRGGGGVLINLSQVDVYT